MSVFYLKKFQMSKINYFLLRYRYPKQKNRGFPLFIYQFNNLSLAFSFFFATGMISGIYLSQNALRAFK